MNIEEIKKLEKQAYHSGFNYGVVVISLFWSIVLLALLITKTL